MKHKLLIIMLAATLPIWGQSHIVGIKSGINLSNVKTSNFNSIITNRTGFGSGINYEFQPNDKYKLLVDLIYLQNGFVRDKTATGETLNASYHYGYLSLPIKAGVAFGEKIGYIALGIVPAILVNDNAMLPTPQDIANNGQLANLTNEPSKFDLAGVVEVGANYEFNEKYILTISVAYQQSFTSITNANYWPDSKIQHYGIQLSLGLKYILKSKKNEEPEEMPVEIEEPGF